jgi:type IV pilus assembly protein PilX
MKTLKHLTPRPATRQRGVALITDLILFVIMTLLGLAAIRNITQEERMAGHSYSRSLAFQATESALRSIEQQVEANKPTQAGICGDVSGLMTCAPPAASAVPRWKQLPADFNSWQDLSAIGSGSLAVTPQYFVEYLGNTFPCNPGDPSGTDTCKRYRITVRSSDGSNGKTSVMLQSVYATD